jgi:glycosyltransferase involved in cell wall biosynthesis
MNNEKTIKIAFLTSHKLDDRRTSWPGTDSYIVRALQKYCGDISFLDPIDAPFEMLIGRIFKYSSKFFFKKRFVYEHCFLVAKRCAKVATQRLAGRSFDVIVAPAGATVVAFLETDIPIVLVEDATYGLLFDYYVWFSHLLKRSAYEMNTIQNLALKRANAVLCHSTWAARSAIEEYATDPRKVHVVPVGANLDEGPPREVALGRKKSDHCRLLFLGTDWQRKGGEIAFETLLKLEELGISAELIVCGCTPPKRFSHERMKVIPFLNKNDERQHKELEQLFMMSDFLLLPTRADTFGMVFCEANAFGLPAITTNTGGVPEAVRDGENGFLLPLDARGDAYAEVIATIYRDDQRYAELVKSSRAAYENRLNWDAWGVAVKKIIADLLEHKNS